MTRLQQDLPAARKADEAARARKWAMHASNNGGELSRLTASQPHPQRRAREACAAISKAQGAQQ